MNGPGVPPGGPLPPGGGFPGHSSPYRTPGAPQPAPAGSDNRAIASMVLGIVSVVLSCAPLVGPICGTIAIVLYVKHNAAWRMASGQLGGKGMAIAGLVCGIVGATLGLFYSLYWVVAGAVLGQVTRGLF